MNDDECGCVACGKVSFTPDWIFDTKDLTYEYSS